MNLTEKLNWRYATKRMNGQPVPQEKVNAILEVIQLAPTSMGLQPFHCFVISDKELLKKINAEACQQPQITEGSHLIVFAAWKNITQEHIDAYIKNIADTRNISLESLDGFKQNMIGLMSRPQEVNQNWAARQAYIGLGFGLVAAANEAVDATPMEGFNNAAMDKILGLEEKGLASVCLLNLGYRNLENDPLANAQKVRRNAEELFTKI
jgi:nitroreductase / dihydropteridine reductase